MSFLDNSVFDFTTIPIDKRLEISFEDDNIVSGEKYLYALELYKIYNRSELVERLNKIIGLTGFIKDVSHIEPLDKYNSIEYDFNVLIRDNENGSIDVYTNMYNEIEEYRIALALNATDDLITIHKVTPYNWAELSNHTSMNDYNNLIVFRKIIMDASDSSAEDVSFDHIMVRDDNNRFKANAIIRFKIRGEHVLYNGFKLSVLHQSKMLKDIIALLCPNSSLDIDTIEGIQTSIADTFGDGSVSLRFTAKPTVCGYSCTVRLQNMKTVSLQIEELGFPLEQQIILNRLAKKTTGLTLITGAKGSGKNTTAFAIANSMQKYPVKIQDFSSPVEVYMPFTQIDYNNNVEKLVNLCRLSKKEATEVIMLNEIPDQSVAFAVQDLVNSSTHVITTTHIDRVWHFPFKLYELYGEDYRNIISQLNAVINQKMFYKQCKHCASRTGIIGIEDINIENFMISRGYNYHYINDGCSKCTNGVDLNGVQPYAEIFVLTPSIKSDLQKCSKPYEMENYIKEYMLSKGLSFEYSLSKAVDEGNLSIDNLIAIV